MSESYLPIFTGDNVLKLELERGFSRVFIYQFQ
jgi:hypothetical protein